MMMNGRAHGNPKRDRETKCSKNFIAAYEYFKTIPISQGENRLVDFAVGGLISNMMAVEILSWEAFFPLLWRSAPQPKQSCLKSGSINVTYMLV